MRPRFLCVGDLDVDLMVSVSRTPNADEKVSGQRVCQAIGGMAANVAVGLSRLGATARLVASMGDDENGSMAKKALIQEGVDIRYLVCLKGETTFMCIVLLTPDGEKSLIRVETAAYLPALQDIPDAAFDNTEHVHLTFGSEQLARHCIARAKAAGATVSLDIEKADVEGNPFRFVDLIPDIDWLFMNRCTRRFIEETAGKGVLDAAPCVITTLGSSGSQIVRNGVRTVVSGHAVQVLDSTGAGDSLVAAFLYSRLIEGRSEAEALYRANAAAAMVVQRYGAQTGLPTLTDIDRFLAG